MKRTTLSFAIAATAAFLSGCGGGDYTPPVDTNTTSVHGKVLSSNSALYRVCLDTTNDESCSDENSSYSTLTNSNGEYTLNNLPKEQLEGYYIVAKPEATSHRNMYDTTLIAPANSLLNASAHDYEMNLSPLLSMLTKLKKDSGLNFAPMYTETLTTMLDINGSINIAAIDYLSDDQKDESYQAFKVLNNTLFSDDNYAKVFDPNAQPSSDYITASLQKTQELLGKAFAQSVHTDALQKYSGENALRSELLFYTRPQFYAPYNAGNDSSVFQDKINAADLSTAVRIIGAEVRSHNTANAHPIISFIGFAADVALEFWPEDEEDLSYLITLKKSVESAVREHVKNNYNTKFRSLKSALEKYRNTQDDKYFNTHVFDASYTVLNDISNDKLYKYELLPQYVFALNIRMVAHVERLKLFQEGKKVADSIDQIYKDMVYDYAHYRDVLLVKDENDKDKYSYVKRYLNHRWGNIHKSHGLTDLTMVLNKCWGEVEDVTRGFKIRWEVYKDDCNAAPNFFESSTINVEKRLYNEAKLEVAKLVSSVFMLSRMIPAGKLEEYAKKLDLTVYSAEKDATLSYYVPDDLKSITVGPISRSCLVSDDYDLRRGYKKELLAKCENPAETQVHWDKTVVSLKGEYYKPNIDHNKNYRISKLTFKEQGGTEKTLGGVSGSSSDLADPPSGYKLIGFDTMTFEHKTDSCSGGFRDYCVDLGLLNIAPQFAGKQEKKKTGQWKKQINTTTYERFGTPIFIGPPVNYNILGSLDYPVSLVSYAGDGRQSLVNTMYYFFVEFRFTPDGETMLPR